MRKLLNGLYDGAAWAAALCLVGVLGTVLLSIVGRQLHFHVPGTDAYAGYLMAGAGFLALAHTLKRGEHIRVTLIINALQGPARRALELWALGAATALAGLFAFFSVRMAYQSRVLNDISTGNDATPLWIPQIAFGLGTVILFIAFADELWSELRGTRRRAPTEAALHNE